MMSSETADKAFARAFCLLAVGAFLLPLRENWRKHPKDGFPLSYYPMFSAKRGKLTRVNYLLGLDASGNRRLLPYTLAGTGGMNQVRRQINRALREGREAELCRAVASAVAASPDRELRSVTRVLVVKGSYRLERYFAGEKEPYKERVAASSAVLREVEAS